MASHTPRFGLYMKNTSTDGEDTFNIDTMLNENLMKIDQLAAKLGQDGKVLSEQLPQIVISDASLVSKGLVQLSNFVDKADETRAATPKAVKMAYDLAKGKESPEGVLAKIEQTSFQKTKSDKDTQGIFKTVEYRRKSDGKLAIKAVLSGGTSPYYSTRTMTYYANDGITVVKTETFALSYDPDGTLISEV